jgi:hypothetical protein
VKQITYNASRTLGHFHASDAFVRGLMGPIGSGKSVGCCSEIMRRSCEQRAFEGKRKSRWAVIRNTYRELIDTTCNTFFDWFPKDAGTWRQADMQWNFTQRLADGTVIELEVLFRALDRPDDVKKLLSLELTGAWVNEAREIPKPVLDMLQGRVGRYPSMRDGGAGWFGVIMDTNPPDSDHWWYVLFEETRPHNFQLFKQPSGLSDKAENLENLPANYYPNMMAGKTQEWINVYVHGLYGFVSDGRVVWPEYKDDIHATDSDIDPLGLVIVGIDFGLTPAASIGQIAPSGRLEAIDELIGEDMGALNFGRQLKRKLDTEYRGVMLDLYGDPAGEQRAQTDETTPFQILWGLGLSVSPAPTNDFTLRREAVADYMMRLDFVGRPAFAVGPKARMTRKALAGGYKYKRVQVAGDERYHDQPDKNKYSHIGDALQYMVLGAAGYGSVIGAGKASKPLDYSVQNRSTF